MSILTKDRSYYKTLVALAIPIGLQQLITFSIGFTDNLMVGTLGDTAISGVYMGNQIQTVLQLVMGGIGAAMGILSAQYWGVKDTNSIKKIVSIACRFALIVGAILTAIAISFPHFLISLFTPDKGVINEGSSYLFIISFSYIFFCISQILVASMRSVEKAKVGMMLSFITFLTNCSLNYIFIFGKLCFPAMGAKGAALGTLISRIIEFTLILLYVIKIDKILRIKLKDFLIIEKTLAQKFIKYGLPVVGGDAVWSVNMLSQSAILGRFNQEAIAAISIASMLNNLAYIWVMALGAAVGIITSKTVGSGQYEKMKEYAKTTQVLFLIVGLCTGLILFLVKAPFLSLYNVSELSQIMANQMMTVLSVTIIGSSYQATCLAGLVKSGGDTSFVFKNDSIFVFLVLIPSGIISMYLGAPAWVVFACLKADQILKCFVAVVKINSFNWMKNLTK